MKKSREKNKAMLSYLVVRAVLIMKQKNHEPFRLGASASGVSHSSIPVGYVKGLADILCDQYPWKRSWASRIFSLSITREVDTREGPENIRGNAFWHACMHSVRLAFQGY